MKLEDAIKTSKFTNERHKALLNLLYTAYWLKNHFSKHYKKNGLTLEQYNVMRILNGKYPDMMCVKDIASRMLEKNSNVPRIIDRLVRKQIVERSTSRADKRETLISLTVPGRETLIEATRCIDDLTQNIVGLDEDDAGNFNELLEKFRKID